MKKFYIQKEATQEEYHRNTRINLETDDEKNDEEKEQTQPTDIQGESSKNDYRTNEIETCQDKPLRPTELPDSSTEFLASLSPALLQILRQFARHRKSISTNGESLKNKYGTDDIESQKVESRTSSEILDSSGTSKSQNLQGPPSEPFNDALQFGLFFKAKEQSAGSDVQVKSRKALRTVDIESREVENQTSSEILDSSGTSGSRNPQGPPARPFSNALQCGPFFKTEEQSQCANVQDKLKVLRIDDSKSHNVKPPTSSAILFSSGISGSRNPQDAPAKPFSDALPSEVIFKAKEQSSSANDQVKSWQGPPSKPFNDALQFGPFFKEKEQSSGSDVQVKSRKVLRTVDIESREVGHQTSSEILDFSGTSGSQNPQGPPTKPFSEALHCGPFFEAKKQSPCSNVQNKMEVLRIDDSKSHNIKPPTSSAILFSSGTSGSRNPQDAPAKPFSEALHCGPIFNVKEQSPVANVQVKSRKILRTDKIESRKVEPRRSSGGNKIRQRLSTTMTLPCVPFVREWKHTPGTDVQQEECLRNKYRTEFIESCRVKPPTPSDFLATSSGSRIRHTRPPSDLSLNAPFFPEKKHTPGPGISRGCFTSECRTGTPRDEPPTSSVSIETLKHPLWNTLEHNRNCQCTPSGHSPSGQDRSKRPCSPVDRFDAFGKMVATKLRDLHRDQRRWAEKFIYDVLFEAEDWNLHDGCQLERWMPHEHPSSCDHRCFHPANN